MMMSAGIDPEDQSTRFFIPPVSQLSRFSARMSITA